MTSTSSVTTTTTTTGNVTANPNATEDAAVEQTVAMELKTTVSMDASFGSDEPGQVVLANAQSIATLSSLATAFCSGVGTICEAGGVLPSAKTCCVQLAECATLTVAGTPTNGDCATTSPEKEMGLLKVSARRRRMESSKRRLSSVEVKYGAKGESKVKATPAALTQKVAIFDAGKDTQVAKDAFDTAVKATVAAIVAGTPIVIGQPGVAGGTSAGTAGLRGGATPAQMGAVANATASLTFAPVATAVVQSTGSSTSSAAGAIVSGLTVLAAAFFTF